MALVCHTTLPVKNALGHRLPLSRQWWYQYRTTRLPAATPIPRGRGSRIEKRRGRMEEGAAGGTGG